MALNDFGGAFKKAKGARCRAPTASKIDVDQLLDSRVHGCEFCCQACAQRADDGGNGHRNTGSDQTVFNSCRTAFVGDKRLQELAHIRIP